MLDDGQRSPAEESLTVGVRVRCRLVTEGRDLNQIRCGVNASVRADDPWESDPDICDVS